MTNISKFYTNIATNLTVPWRTTPMRAKAHWFANLISFSRESYFLITRTYVGREHFESQHGEGDIRLEFITNFTEAIPYSNDSRVTIWTDEE